MFVYNPLLRSDFALNLKISFTHEKMQRHTHSQNFNESRLARSIGPNYSYSTTLCERC